MMPASALRRLEKTVQHTKLSAAAAEEQVVPHAPCPHFAVGDPAAAEYLRDEGYCVFADVLTPHECTAGVDGIWQWLEGLGSGIRRQDPATWNDARWPEVRDDGGVGLLAIASPPACR